LEARPTSSKIKAENIGQDITLLSCLSTPCNKFTDPNGIPENTTWHIKVNI